MGLVTAWRQLAKKGASPQGPGAAPRKLRAVPMSWNGIARAPSKSCGSRPKARSIGQTDKCHLLWKCLGGPSPRTSAAADTNPWWRALPFRWENSHVSSTLGFLVCHEGKAFLLGPQEHRSGDRALCFILAPLLGPAGGLRPILDKYQLSPVGSALICYPWMRPFNRCLVTQAHEVLPASQMLGSSHKTRIKKKKKSGVGKKSPDFTENEALQSC